MGFLKSLSLAVFVGMLASVAISDSQCTTSAGHFNCREFINRATCSPGEFELLHCDYNETEFDFLSVIIKNQTFTLKNSSQEKYTMSLYLPNDNDHNPSCAYPETPRYVNMRLPDIFISTSIIDVFFGPDPGKDLPEFRKFQCGLLDDWVYWGSNEYPTPSHIVDSCKIHFLLMNGRTLDVIRSRTHTQQFWENLLTALWNEFEVSIRFPSPPPQPSQPSATKDGKPPQPSQPSATKDGKPRKGEWNHKRKLIVGFSVSRVTALIMCAIFLFYLRHRKTKCYTRNMSCDTSSIADPEKMSALYGVKFFTYDELEKATDNFSESREIGDGGFGTVYLGKLEDGRTVAVKRLYENNYRRVEQFLNEVEILARLRHQNLVMLYGCTSRHSRELLLVYEYISNGTVADHLHGEKVNPGSLLWDTRLKIAVETARALKYLHASDIIHRDVKTNNILLEDNFTVKVADFGLSRLFPLHVTHVSTAPQGTPGYVDPEYRQCYQLTDKSDVYSFGVVLAELISSKPAVDLTRHRHEINLSNMAVNKIQNDQLHEFVDPSLGFDRDPNVRKMITAVAELAFQCLQCDKDMRPSMQEVLNILMQIQSGESQTNENAEELEIFSDEFHLLKSGSLSLSPDSKAVKMVSSSNTSSTCG